MIDKHVGLGAALAIALGSVLFSPRTSYAQAPERVAWQPKLLPDGQPDIEGYWNQRDNVTPYSLERGDEDRAEHVRITGQRTATGKPIIDPPTGRIPFQPWAAQKYQHLLDVHTGPTDVTDLDPVARGFLEGTPRITYQTDFQVLQPEGYVVLMYEYGHHYRVIPLDDRPHLPADIGLWMGDSRGHWEGTTLVVDVTNNNDQTWLDQVGAFHSDAMRVTERFAFVSPGHITYTATIDDPKVFTKPWTIGLHLVRNNDPSYEQMESAVWEGNKAVEFMLRTPPPATTPAQNTAERKH
jgi:hypothetical protein